MKRLRIAVLGYELLVLTWERPCPEVLFTGQADDYDYTTADLVRDAVD